MINEKEIYQAALKKWGADFQTDMVIEECSELILSILGNRRKKTTIREIKREVVDVQIMIDQLKIMVFDAEDEFIRYKELKLERLLKRINEEDEL